MSHVSEKPSAVNDAATPPLPALALIRTSRFTRVFARIVITGFFVVLLGLLFLPWRQFVSGAGRVIAFDPLERRINIESVLSGRVKTMTIKEGDRVKKDQVIAEIQDNDPNLLKNMRLQREAVANRIELAKERAVTIRSQITQQELGKVQALDAADQRVIAAKIAAETADLQYKRVSTLHEKGITSRRDYELAKLQKESNDASLKSAVAARAGTVASYDSTIASINATLASAKSDIQSATRDLTAMDIQISQTERQTVVAPRDGIVLSVAATDGTYLRPGSPIAVIIPETESRFVEIWIDGNDAPLVKTRRVVDGKVVEKGSPVRIAFSGWPAVQAIGWPNLAVGTFGGEVVFMDPTDDGKGKFRIVVAEDPDVVEREGKMVVRHWPDRQIWLRQGVRANGWVMLNRVRLWFEIWRQINGFPPVITNGADKAAGYDKK